jgi:hypothetical protein
MSTCRLCFAGSAAGGCQRRPRGRRCARRWSRRRSRRRRTTRWAAAGTAPPGAPGSRSRTRWRPSTGPWRCGRVSWERMRHGLHGHRAPFRSSLDSLRVHVRTALGGVQPGQQASAPRGPPQLTARARFAARAPVAGALLLQSAGGRARATGACGAVRAHPGAGAGPVAGAAGPGLLGALAHAAAAVTAPARRWAPCVSCTRGVCRACGLAGPRPCTAWPATGVPRTCAGFGGGGFWQIAAHICQSAVLAGRVADGWEMQVWRGGTVADADSQCTAAQV